MVKHQATKNPYRFISSLAVFSSIGPILLFARVIGSDSMRYVFLIWNLALAALVPLLAWWLISRICVHGWLHWQQIFLTIIWISFLPNSFYLITDYIHLRETYEASLLYDVTMMTSFVLSGLILGMTSVYLVHKQLEKRFKAQDAWLIVGAIFLASSFAIYLGRYTRWNTWDIILRPAGLLFDVSDRFVNPAAHGDTYLTTLVFFFILFSLYWVVYETAQFLRR